MADRCLYPVFGIAIPANPPEFVPTDLDDTIDISSETGKTNVYMGKIEEQLRVFTATMSAQMATLGSLHSSPQRQIFSDHVYLRIS